MHTQAVLIICPDLVEQLFKLALLVVSVEFLCGETFDVDVVVIIF